VYTARQQNPAGENGKVEKKNFSKFPGVHSTPSLPAPSIGAQSKARPVDARDGDEFRTRGTKCFYIRKKVYTARLRKRCTQDGNKIRRENLNFFFFSGGKS
jgi:hypothetical protein